MIPDDLHYTAEHEWVKVVTDGVRIGITDHAQEALGDIVFVTLPAVGTHVEAGQSLGEVESTKSVSDIYAPSPARSRLAMTSSTHAPSWSTPTPTARVGSSNCGRPIRPQSRDCSTPVPTRPCSPVDRCAARA